MKRLIIYFSSAAIAFAIGVSAFVASNVDRIQRQSPDEPPIAEVTTDVTSEEGQVSDEYKAALENIWIDDDQTQVGEYKIVRTCSLETDGLDLCGISISKSGKVVDRIDTIYGRKKWLRYGFFNFLGKEDKQLIVHTYSGGAHCCYDYYIFDLGDSFKKLYSSAKFDSANEIGNQLVPVDIDRDGIFEFYQEVMAFDYMGFAGHASATFPPAIFAYKKTEQRFVLSTRRFPEFVLGLMQENIDGMQKWQMEHNQRVTDGSNAMYRITDDEVNEVAVREKFLFMVYAGKRDEGWKYFKLNYKTPTGKGYQDEFREKFISDFHQIFKKDPTYQSIYGR